MAKIWVVNASPLILLGKIQRLDLLSSLCDELVVPRAVEVEVTVEPEGRLHLDSLLSRKNVRLGDDLEIPSGIETWDLGLGESSVLVHASRIRDATAVLDDLEARLGSARLGSARLGAAVLGIPFVGTVGVVLEYRFP